MLCHMEALLLRVGPLLRRQSYADYAHAASVFASIVRDQRYAPPSAAATQAYDHALSLRHGDPVDAPVRLPAHARGKFPFDRPTPHLRDMQDRIEAMLVPVQHSRPKARHLARLLRSFDSRTYQEGPPT